MAKARSISAANLTELTRAAVKAATTNVPGKFVGKGPTMGYMLQQKGRSSGQLELARQITEGVAANAREEGISGLKPKPVVVVRPGRVIAGFIESELGVTIRR